MEDACMNAIIGTLLIVESFVEADDLQDAFEQRRLGPVVHMRSVETARAMLQETGRKPQIIVVGAAADARPGACPDRGTERSQGASSDPQRRYGRRIDPGRDSPVAALRRTRAEFGDRPARRVGPVRSGWPLA